MLTPGRFSSVSLLAGVALALCGVKSAEASSVTGSIVLPDAALLGKPDQRSQGFVERFSNPLRTARPYDPRPEMVVVLEGAIPAESKAAPKRPVKLTVIGESFSSRLLPVVVGSIVAISNSGRSKPRLHSPTHPKIFSDSSPLTASEREIKIDSSLTVVKIRDHESEHLAGAIVAFPHSLFASVQPNGTFEIANVPAGKWRVRVWYRDGWLEMKEPSVDVIGKRPAKVKVVIPPAMSAKKPN